MAKKFSVRIELELEANTDNEAKTKAANIIKELPRMDGLYTKKYSVFNKSTKSVIHEG